MTRAATAAGHARKVRRATGPRRVSGPARTPKGRGHATKTTAKRPPFAGLAAFGPRRISGGGAVALPAPRGRTRTADRGLARRLGALVEHPWLDKLLSGRLWIAIIAVGLIGLVFMQVSLLKLNAGMGEAVERGEVLSRQNAVLRADVSKLEAPDRIQQLALAAQMVLPAADQVTFLGENGKRMSGAEKPAEGEASTAILPVTPQQQAVQAQTPAPTTTVTPPATTSTPTATTAPPPTAQTPAATQTPTATPAATPTATPTAATPAPPAAAPATSTPTATGGAVAGG
jgi:hypothetical protein